MKSKFINGNKIWEFDFVNNEIREVDIIQSQRINYLKFNESFLDFSVNSDNQIGILTLNNEQKTKTLTIYDSDFKEKTNLIIKNDNDLKYTGYIGAEQNLVLFGKNNFLVYE